jgi:hypothetical protein
MMPYTPIEVSASRASRPALTSASTTPSSKGTTAQAAKAGASASTGASLYRKGLALLGTISSLNSILNTSAKAWIQPMPKMRPMYCGPWRTCIHPITLRSAST